MNKTNRENVPPGAAETVPKNHTGQLVGIQKIGGENQGDFFVIGQDDFGVWAVRIGDTMGQRQFFVTGGPHPSYRVMPASARIARDEPNSGHFGGLAMALIGQPENLTMPYASVPERAARCIARLSLDLDAANKHDAWVADQLGKTQAELKAAHELLGTAIPEEDEDFDDEDTLVQSKLAVPPINVNVQVSIGGGGKPVSHGSFIRSKDLEARIGLMLLDRLLAGFRQ